MISVTEVNTYDEGSAWDRYVLNHSMGSGYQLMGWRRVVERAFGHRTFYLMARDEHEQVRGVLPLVLLSSRLFGRFLVSMPFVNYGGVLTDNFEAQRALLDAAARLATQPRGDAYRAPPPERARPRLEIEAAQSLDAARPAA